MAQRALPNSQWRAPVSGTTARSGGVGPFSPSIDSSDASQVAEQRPDQEFCCCSAARSLLQLPATQRDYSCCGLAFCLVPELLPRKKLRNRAVVASDVSESATTWGTSSGGSSKARKRKRPLLRTWHGFSTPRRTRWCERAWGSTQRDNVQFSVMGDAVRTGTGSLQSPGTL